MRLDLNSCIRNARCLVALVLFGLAPAGAMPELIDRIAAVVDDEIILWSELNYRLQVTLQESGYRALPPPTELDSLRGQILTAMVDEQVLILKAEKDSVVVDENAVQEDTERRFSEVKQGLPEGEFSLMLERSGLTERQLKSRLRKQVRASKLFESMQQEVYWNTHVSRRDVETYRQAHSETQPPVISLSQIQITVKPDTAALAAVQEKINVVQKQLAAGQDFAILARTHSEDPGTATAGGSLGCFGPGLLVPEFENAANQLKPGEISEPVLTQFGYHLIRLDEKREDELCASHVLIRTATSDQDRERVRRTLVELRTRAAEGADFAALARVHSEGPGAMRGGLMGNIPVEAIPYYLQTHIGHLQLGQISEPFFIEDVGQLIKINDDQAILESLIRENRTAATMQELINGHKTEIHLDTRLREDAESPLGYVAP